MTAFVNTAGQNYESTIEELTKIRKAPLKPFVSFESFFKEFTKAIHPHLKKMTFRMLQTAKQGEKESLEDYKSRYLELLELAGEKEENYVWSFIQGFKNRKYSDAALSSASGDEALTIDKCYKEAKKLETYNKMTGMSANASAATGSSASTNNNNNNGASTKQRGGGAAKGGTAKGAGKGGGAAGGGQQQQQQQQQKPQQQQQQQQQGAARGGVRGRGAWRGRGRGRGRGARGSTAAVNEVFVQNEFHSIAPPNPQKGDFEAWRTWYEYDGTAEEWIESCKEALPPSFRDKYRCLGCLGEGHEWDLTFRRCPKPRRCPFCSTSYFHGYSHPASLCPEKPQTEDEIRAALEAAVEASA